MRLPIVSSLSVSLLLCTLFALDSCGGGRNYPKLTPISPVSIRAQHQISDDDADVHFHPSAIVVGPDHGVTLLRRSTEKACAVEHYAADSLGIDWSLPFTMDKKDEWTSPVGRHIGEQYSVVSLYQYDGGDSMAFRFLSVDARTHQIVTDAWPARMAISKPGFMKAARFGKYNMVLSPDSNLVLFYLANFTDVIERETGKLLRVNTWLYDFSGKLIGTRELQLAMPQNAATQSAKIEFKGGHMTTGEYNPCRPFQSVQVDNAGNLYAVTYTTPDSMNVTQYDARTGAPRTLSATFQNVDVDHDKELTPPVSLVPSTSVVTVVAGKKAGNDIVGFVFGTFDFRAGSVRASQYEPTTAELEKVIGRKTLEGYRPSSIIRDDASARTLVILERRVDVTVITTQAVPSALKDPSLNPGIEQTTSSSHNEEVLCGIVLCGFNDGGQPLWQYAVPTDQSKGFHYFQGYTNGMLDIFYSQWHYDSSALFKQEFNIATGTLSPEQRIIQCQAGTSILTGFSVWKPEEMLLFAMGEETFGLKARPRFPMILRASLQ